MLNIWKNKKNKKDIVVTQKPIKNVAMKPLNYHPKVILAWAKALEGNEKIAVWLKENGFQELVFANAAINLKTEARNWLMDNGFPHLMAMIHAAEGNEKAQKWLLNNNFEILYHIALAVEDDQESWKWLNLNATQDLFLLATSLKKIKDRIEVNHNDVHSFRKD
jgi:hypothetical protein